MFLRSPGFTAVAVLTLALGIGATTAVFGLLEALLLRPYDAPHADRLVVPHLTFKSEGGRPVLVWSYPKYKTLLENQDVFEDIGGFRDTDFNLDGEHGAERVRGELAMPSYLDILGMRPVLGRGFGAAEEKTDTAQVALLGYGLWQSHFGGDPSIVGRPIRIAGVSYTVVGVAPRGFRGLSGTSELWLPFALAPKLMHPEMLTMRWAHWFETVARLKPGISRAALAARMAALGKIIEAAHPARTASEALGAAALPLGEARKDPKLRVSVLVLFGAVALVLLIGCVNVAHLLLSRAAGRRHELAVRAALGASRPRLVRQLLTESLILGLAGGGLGLGLAMWGVDLLAALKPASVIDVGVGAAELNDLSAMGFSFWVPAFAVALSVAAAALFGIVPALSSTRVNLATRMQETGMTMTARMPGRGVLAALEVALALVVLAGAGLLMRSMAKVAAVDLGFRGEHVLAARIEPPRRGEDREKPWAARAELEERLRALPGVEAVGFDECAPPLGQCDATGVDKIEGRPPFPEGSEPPVGVHFVNPDFFHALGMPVLRGRGLGPGDRLGAPKVVLLNQAAALSLFPGEDAIGKRLHAAYGEEDMVEVVGVTGDVRYDGPMEPARPALYVPSAQIGPRTGWVFVRTAGDPLALAGAVREAARAFDREMPIFNMQTLAERARDATGRLRFAALILAAFSGVALLLAAIGIYGVMATTVAQRRREIGIRVALGARAGEVVAMLLRQGVTVALAGTAAGLLLALALSRVLAGLVFGVTVTDPLTFAAVAAALAGVGVLACLLAARRALRVNPAEVLRSE